MSNKNSKVIILTGASRGIGLVVAHYLLSHADKHRLVLTARSEKPLKELEQQYPGQVAVLTGDASDLSLGGKAVELAEDRWQRLDGVIINHGVLDPVTRVANAKAEDWRKAFDINFFSAVALVQAALPALRDSKGAIIFTSSGAASRGFPTWGAYGAAKAAMNHLAMTLGSEEKEITSIAIRPGVVDTEMQREVREKHNGVMDEEHVKHFASLKSDGHLLKAELPGHVMAKLVLDPPRDLNGHFLDWNAGELKAYQEM